MAAAARKLGRIFHSDRMVGEYVSQAYIPAADRVSMLSADGDVKAKELAAWKEKGPSGVGRGRFRLRHHRAGGPRARDAG